MGLTFIDNKKWQDITREETYNALLKGFTKNKEFDFSELTVEELERAKQLSKEKYKTDEWNYMK